MRNGAPEPDIQSVWAKLAAPLPPEAIRWRQDGKVIQRDGKYYARFIRFAQAAAMRERLDEVVPGEWSDTLEPLAPMVSVDRDGIESRMFAFRCRLQVLGVGREDVGQGKDYKTAATDAFKRACFAFGLARELSGGPQNWVQMDGDGKYAKPVEDLWAAYDRALSRRSGAKQGAPKAGAVSEGAQVSAARTAAPATPAAAAPARTPGGEVPKCPECGGEMWDNRLTKKGKQPDFKCRDKTCDHAIWLNPKKAPKPAAGEESLELSNSDDLPF